MVVRELDPSEFRRPREKRPTRHIYLANCGQGCGDSTQSVLEVLDTAVPGTVVEGLHVGTAGVSYASLATAEEAEHICGRLAEIAPRWVVRFAELPAESQRAPLVPSSVASTAAVDVPGLELLPDFVSEAEAHELLAAIDACPWDTSIKRRVQHYGHAFDYARLAIAENIAAAPPQLPEFSAGVVQRLTNLGRLPHVVNQLTVNEYLPGVGIASHCDAHSAFEDGIVALTLGSGIVMEFRRPETDSTSGKISVGKHHRLALPPHSENHAPHKNVWLPANSLLIMRGEARYAWQHGIAWRKTDCIDDGQTIVRGRRISLTFRTARHRPCDCQWPLLCNSQNPSTHVLPSRLGAPAAQPESQQHEE